jgi:crotonobetainyl-CoA:carnitine CoA-transferase CaiB-like acyl-CoA transferase
MMGPLEGIKIIDLTSMISGPMGAMILADQGAEVIKVEPLAGEQLRHMASTHNGVNAPFYSCNRGKKSLAIDLKSQEGKEVLIKLAEESDVFIQNFRPGTIDRMGFGFEELNKINPRLIYLSISGFGNQGPYAQSRVYDPVIQALSGATDIQADRDTGIPKMFRIVIADKVTSLTASQAVASALYAREKTSKGQHIRLSMLDSVVAFFWPEGMTGLVFADNEFDVRKLQGSQDLIYKAKDRYITAGAVSDAEWIGMCKALEMTQLIEDVRFSTSAARVINSEERKKITGREIEKWHSEEILERFQAEGVPSAPLLNRNELMDHEQVIANQTIMRTEYEGFGEVRQAKPAALFEDTPSKISRPAPKLGEHSKEILLSLNYNSKEIEELIKAKVLVDSE